ncbi:MAG: hypothetical protein O3B01_18145 [Planctomycetota bacterium]|nr:hypothetical protein [Planctomycetota bacterium]
MGFTSRIQGWARLEKNRLNDGPESALLRGEHSYPRKLQLLLTIDKVKFDSNSSALELTLLRS